jgi:hypothetical protein
METKPTYTIRAIVSHSFPITFRRNETRITRTTRDERGLYDANNFDVKTSAISKRLNEMTVDILQNSSLHADD